MSTQRSGGSSTGSNMSGSEIDVEPSSSEAPSVNSTHQSFQHVLGHDIVDVYVGGNHGGDEEPIIVTLHKRLLSVKAPCFNNIMSTRASPFDMRETIFLPEVEPKIFDAFTYWLYFNVLPGFYNGSDPEEALSPGERVRFVCFADKYGLNGLVDMIFETFDGFYTDKAEDVPTVKDIEFAYDNTAEDSHIRKTLVNMFTLRLCIDSPELSEGDLKKVAGRSDIVLDVLKCVKGKTTPTGLDTMKMRDIFREWLEDARDRGRYGHDGLSEEQSMALFEHDLNYLMLNLRVDFQEDPMEFGMYSRRDDEIVNITRDEDISE